MQKKYNQYNQSFSIYKKNVITTTFLQQILCGNLLSVVIVGEKR